MTVVLLEVISMNITKWIHSHRCVPVISIEMLEGTAMNITESDSISLSSGSSFPTNAGRNLSEYHRNGCGIKSMKPFQQ